jgi:type II secretory pathway component PulM
MLAAVRAWQAQTSRREQALVVAGATLVVAALAWTFVLGPLARDLDATEAALADARTALAAARLQADELAGLSRTPLPPVVTQARADVERVLAQRGLRGSVTALQAKDQRVELTFEAIDLPALTGLVEALGREARMHPVDALLAARTTPGGVRAELVLVRPGAP